MKNVRLVSLTFVAAAALAAFFMPILVGGQEGPAKSGAPAYTEGLHSKALPPPPMFGGVIKDTAAESTPWWPPNLFHNTTPIAPCEGNPSWNSQMLTH